MGFLTHQNQVVGVGQEVPVVHDLLVLAAAAAAERQPREETGLAETPGHSSASAPLGPAQATADVMPFETSRSGQKNLGTLGLPISWPFPYTYVS